MGRDLNMATFIGRLTRDPETKYTQSGKCLCNMTIAIGCDYYNSEKQKVEETTFADITIWGKQAENCSKYLRKGSQVCVNGRLKTERWVDNTTQKNRSKLAIAADNIQFLEKISAADVYNNNDQQDSDGEDWGNMPY